MNSFIASSGGRNILLWAPVVTMQRSASSYDSVCLSGLFNCDATMVRPSTLSSSRTVAQRNQLEQASHFEAAMRLTHHFGRPFGFSGAQCRHRQADSAIQRTQKVDGRDFPH
ncbi:MAG: hypothetical protein IPG06_22885 [Haliea sp.]|nr:hypothetical protein [Haliea sp.]